MTIPGAPASAEGRLRARDRAPDWALSQLSEFLRNVAEFGEHDRRVADSIASEAGSNRVDRAVQSPAGGTGSSTGPVALVTEPERQLKLEDGFVDEMRHRDGQQGDLVLAGMVGKGCAGKVHGDFGKRQRR